MNVSIPGTRTDVGVDPIRYRPRRTRHRVLLIALGAIGALSILGCGDDSPTGGTTTTTTVRPTAAIHVTGNGTIVVGPSLDATFCCSTVFPVRIVETGGGTAIWNFFRVSFFLNGQEIERTEVGSDVINQSGRRNINANSTTDVPVLVRSNTLDFDGVRIRLGFADTRDGRAFESDLDLGSFDGVLVTPIPAALPEASAPVIVEATRD